MNNYNKWWYHSKEHDGVMFVFRTSKDRGYGWDCKGNFFEDSYVNFLRFKPVVDGKRLKVLKTQMKYKTSILFFREVYYTLKQFDIVKFNHSDKLIDLLNTERVFDDFIIMLEYNLSIQLCETISSQDTVADLLNYIFIEKCK